MLALRFMRTALPVLQLNHSVPANCTAAASQSTSRGAATQKRRAGVGPAGAAAATASRYCSVAAAVKHTEPTKNVTDVVRAPTAWA